MLITPEQVRAARALLRLDQSTLARNAGISIVTLRRLEEQHGLGKVAPTTVDIVRQALEKSGAEFIDRGVRRNAPSPDEIRAKKQRIDRIIADNAIRMEKFPPLTDDELWDENGL